MDRNIERKNLKKNLNTESKFFLICKAKDWGNISRTQDLALYIPRFCQHVVVMNISDTSRYDFFFSFWYFPQHMLLIPIF